MGRESGVAAFVPMKGHSERVPGKNLRSLEGKPLYHWVVNELFRVESVSTVLIDTDSEDIAADVERSFPAVRVLWRPDELRGDYTPMHAILVHDAQHVDEDLLLQTHATNPLLTASTIQKSIDALLGRPEHDSLMSVTELRSRFYWPDGSPVNHDPANLVRTQDLGPVYEENSCLYVFPREVLDRKAMRVGDHPLLYPIPALEAIDIDEELDFTIAEALMALREGSR